MVKHLIVTLALAAGNAPADDEKGEAALLALSR
jgi:hypothetical protein